MKYLLAFILFSYFVGSQLSGKWKNELGSTMELECSSDGSLSGSYMSAVGKCKGWYPLSGYCIENSNRSSVGFTGRWINGMVDTKAVTVWNGLLFSEDGKLETDWLIVEQTDVGGQVEVGQLGARRVRTNLMGSNVFRNKVSMLEWNRHWRRAFT